MTEEQPLSELSDEEFQELLSGHDVWQRDRTNEIGLEMVRRGWLDRKGKRHE